MRQFTLQQWDKAYDPTAWNNFTMPLLPMSMRNTELR